jgi:hypothetical protein
LIIIGREVDNEPSVVRPRYAARLDYLFYNAFRGIIGPYGGARQITF